MRDKRKDARELVGRMLRGERGVFERFYRENRLSLGRFVRGKIGEREEVDEVVQDSFLGFLDSLPLFGYRSSLKTFLYSIARHEVADYFRRRYAKRALRLVPIVGEFVTRELYSTAELSGRIDGVYRNLMPEYALILQLKYEEGLSVKQIAKRLKVSVKAAESKLFRARRTFQAVYLAEEEI